jgi:hypothetical protein
MLLLLLCLTGYHDECPGVSYTGRDTCTCACHRP